jgi:hypothetical protein
MSNRFHSKFHRSNHHTYLANNNPDTGHDPIASVDLPFRGDFILCGALSAVAMLSAYAGYFYTNNTAICAWAGKRGMYVNAHDSLGLEIISSQYRAISAYAPDIGIEVGSRNIGLSSQGAKIGIIAYSSTQAVSAYGADIGIEVGSNIYGLSAQGNNIAILASSSNKALSAYGTNMGIEVGSPNIGLSSQGNNIAIIGYSTNQAMSALGTNMGIEVGSYNIGLSSQGRNIGIVTSSSKTA